jgi:3-methylcrotonyl-CoA carboxylase alpha subunit
MMNLAAALYAVRVWPVKTNAAFLLACLNDPAFQAGNVTTALIAEAGEKLTALPELEDNEWQLAALQLFAPFYESGESSDSDPWTGNFGFRLNAADRNAIVVQFGDERRAIDLEGSTSATGFSSLIDDGALVYKDGHPFLFTLSRFDGKGGQSAHDGDIEAPMPGKVTAVEVSQGEKVSKGQRLLTLEAMKMEHALTAPFDGTVTELNAAAGGQVTDGQLLARVEAEPSAG